MWIYKYNKKISLTTNALNCGSANCLKAHCQLEKRLVHEGALK